MAKRKAPDGYDDCECCGQPVIGQWKCDPCTKSGASPCPTSSTWHCSGKFGHACDGTVCPTTEAEMAEWEARQVKVGDRVWIDLFGRGVKAASVQKVVWGVDPYVIVSCNGFSGILKKVEDVYATREDAEK